MIRDMTTGKVPKLLISFALPILIAEILQELHYTIDSLVAGNFLGEMGDLSIAAIGSTWHIIMLLLSFLVGFSMGGSIVIAQFVGASKHHRLAETTSTLILSSLVAAAIFGFVSCFFAEDALRLLQVPAEVLPLATIYLEVMLLGLVFLVGHVLVNSIFRGLGDSRTPLYMVALAVALNVLLNIVLVVFFNGGIFALALATVFSQGIAFLLSVAILMYRRKMLPVSLLKWRFNPLIFFKVVKIALPIGLEMMLAAGSILAISWFINRSGAGVIAGVSIAQNFDEMVIVAGMSIAGALSVFVGQNIAAGKFDRVAKGTRVGVIMAIVCALFATILAFVVDGWFGRLFTDDAQILVNMRQYLTVVALFYFVHSTTLVLGGALQGAGRTLIPMLASLVSLWLVRVPLTWLLSDIWGTDGIWWAQVIAWIICLLLVMSYFMFGKWKSYKAISRTKTLQTRAAEVVKNLPLLWSEVYDAIAVKRWHLD